MAGRFLEHPRRGRRPVEVPQRLRAPASRATTATPHGSSTRAAGSTAISAWSSATTTSARWTGRAGAPRPWRRTSRSPPAFPSATASASSRRAAAPMGAPTSRWAVDGLDSGTQVRASRAPTASAPGTAFTPTVNFASTGTATTSTSWARASRRGHGTAGLQYVLNRTRSRRRHGTIIAGGFDVLTDADAAVDRLERAGVDMDDMCTFGIMPQASTTPARRRRSCGFAGRERRGQGRGQRVRRSAPPSGVAAGATTPFRCWGPRASRWARPPARTRGRSVGGLSAWTASRSPGTSRAPRGNADRGECAIARARRTRRRRAHLRGMRRAAGRAHRGPVGDGEWADFDPADPPHLVGGRDARAAGASAAAADASKLRSHRRAHAIMRACALLAFPSPPLRARPDTRRKPTPRRAPLRRSGAEAPRAAARRSHALFLPRARQGASGRCARLRRLRSSARRSWATASCRARPLREALGRPGLPGGARAPRDEAAAPGLRAHRLRARGPRHAARRHRARRELAELLRGQHRRAPIMRVSPDAFGDRVRGRCGGARLRARPRDGRAAAHALRGEHVGDHRARRTRNRVTPSSRSTSTRAGWCAAWTCPMRCS